MMNRAVMNRAVMNRAARWLVPLGSLALLGCAHLPATRSGGQVWVPAARLTGPTLAREVLVPSRPPLAAPGPEVDRRVAALSGAWDGTWSDDSSSVLFVLRLGAEEALLLFREQPPAATQRL